MTQPGWRQAGNQWSRPVRWVAQPPRTGSPPPRPRRRRRYTGPPAYSGIPRWGFPRVAWRTPTTVPGTPFGRSQLAQRLQRLGRNTVGVLCTVAILATVAAGAEAWRYALLVRSRNTALAVDTVTTSDVLLLIVSLLTFVFGVCAIAVSVWWLLTARGAAAEASGRPPARGVRQTLIGILVPLLNLVLAGAVLAELEHAAGDDAAARRPRPSRLVLSWWGVWIGNEVLLIVTVVRRFGDSMQATADAVLLNAVLNLAAAALAVLTAVVVHRLTRLLTPVESLHPQRMRVVSVHGAPRPTRRERPTTAAR